MTRFKALLANVRGATAVEYGIIAALVAAVAITGFTAVGNKVETKVSGIASSMN